MISDRKFDPAMMDRLDDPARLEWLPPAEIIAHLELRPGQRVADIGCGTGYLAFPLVDAVAPTGKVYAIDAEPQMLRRIIAKEAARQGDTRILPIQAEAADTGLPDEICDRVLLANLWHEVDGQDQVLREAARILKSDGKMAILDWRPDVQQPPGPPLEHRIAAEDVARKLTASKWQVDVTHHIGPFSYLVLARPPKV